MARKRVEVEVPDGTRLGFAQDAEGGMRGLLFDEDTGRLVGHANLFEYSEYEARNGDDNDDEDHGSGGGGGNWDYGEPPPPQRDENIDLVVEVIAQVLTNLLIHGAERAAPHVKNWWSERAVPSLKEKAVPAVKLAPGKLRSAVSRRSRIKAADGGIAAEVVEVNAAGPASDEQIPTVGTAGAAMSSSEAQQRLVRAVAATVFAREQMFILQNARIVDDKDGPSLASLLDDITPEHLEPAIRAALEVTPLMLDGPHLSSFTISLETGRSERDRVWLGVDDQLPVAQRGTEPPA